MSGTLHALGVGPGDPELLTLRAVRLLGEAQLVFAAASPRNEHSLALAIAAPHVRPDTPVVRLDFPMTRDQTVLEQAWLANARTVMAAMETVDSAAFLTLGDPLTYSTFGYLMQTLRRLAPHLAIEVTPGITSYHAAAAKARRVLAEGGENLTIVSGVAPDLAEQLARADNAVILKAYRNFPAIREAVAAQGRFAAPLLVSELHRAGERVTAGLDEAESPPYLSLVLATRDPGG